MKTFFIFVGIIICTFALPDADEDRISTTSAQNYDEDWENFKAKYKKNYDSTSEHDQRRSVFIKNMKLIETHNDEQALGLYTYSLGVNKFADLTTEEFKEFYTGVLPNMYANVSETDPSLGDSSTQEVPRYRVPKSLDWRKKGYVTPVKHQRTCGSCWAFSAVVTIEGAWRKSKGRLVSFSEQQVLDCAPSWENKGCEGGWTSKALGYVKSRGIATERSYPYIRKKHSSCMYKKAKKAAYISNYYRVAPKTERALKTAVAKKGPISVTMHTEVEKWQFYNKHSGIFSSRSCSSDPKDVTHAVAVVGYGSKRGKDYWLIKNSWGKGWGKGGYMWLSRNNKNHCGIANNALYATV